MSRWLIALCLCFIVLSPAFADNGEEIIYRASLGRADDVTLLLKQGASPDQKNSDGVPVIALAAARKDAEGLGVVTALAEGGANVNAVDMKGENALFYAARQDNISIARYLISKKIDFSAINTSGDMPRTIAYNAGFTDIGIAIDEALATSKTVTAQAQLDKQHAAELAKMQAVSKQRDQPVTAKPEAPQPLKSIAPVAQTQAAAPESMPDQQAQTDPLYSDLSYHACAFQYWDFCHDSKQSTELQDDELVIAITSHQEKDEAIKKILSQTYHEDARTINDVETSAQQRVYLQLNKMVSHQERRENGVGKMDDMEKRCKEVSRLWKIPPPGMPKSKPSDKDEDEKRIKVPRANGLNGSNPPNNQQNNTPAPKAKKTVNGVQIPMVPQGGMLMPSNDAQQY